MYALKDSLFRHPFNLKHSHALRRMLLLGFISFKTPRTPSMKAAFITLDFKWGYITSNIEGMYKFIVERFSSWSLKKKKSVESSSSPSSSYSCSLWLVFHVLCLNSVMMDNELIFRSHCLEFITDSKKKKWSMPISK